MVFGKSRVKRGSSLSLERLRQVKRMEFLSKAGGSRFEMNKESSRAVFQSYQSIKKEVNFSDDLQSFFASCLFAK